MRVKLRAVVRLGVQHAIGDAKRPVLAIHVGHCLFEADLEARIAVSAFDLPHRLTFQHSQAVDQQQPSSSLSLHCPDIGV